MNTYLLLLIITSSIVFIWDFLAFPQQIANRVASVITKGKITRVELKKPFGCSLCITFWVTMGYLLFTDISQIYLSLVCAWSTKYLLYLLNLIDMVLVKFFEIAEKPFANKQ